MKIDKKLYVFDMDGTIYLGENAFPFAVSYIKKLRRQGRRVLFFTNNASKSPEFYIKRLTRMGFEPRQDELLTSGDVTVRFLKEKRAGKSVYFDTELTYEKLERACTLIRGGAEYLCTHPDFNCPTETGFIPDSGAIAAAITASTGVKPRFFGKPYADTAEMIFSYTGIEAKDACIFGDRLYTDIALGKNSGMTAVLVLSGETKKSELDGLSPEQMPDIVLDSIKDLL